VQAFNMLHADSKRDWSNQKEEAKDDGGVEDDQDQVRCDLMSLAFAAAPYSIAYRRQYRRWTRSKKLGWMMIKSRSAVKQTRHM
jgi:hypothetical protein